MKFLNKKMLIVALLGFSSITVADDVSDSISEALKHYEKQSYSSAVESLTYATQLIQQKKGDALILLLPKALDGWKAEKPSSQSAAGGMFGGGLTAEGKYKKGSASVKVQIFADSPMVQSMAMLFSNPLVIGSSGGKLEKIAGHKAIVKFEDDKKRGEIKLLIANRFFIQLEGRDTTAEALKNYAKTIDYDKLAKFP